MHDQAGWRAVPFILTVVNQSVGTDRPEQTVDPDQILQNTASDLELHC